MLRRNDNPSRAVIAAVAPITIPGNAPMVAKVIADLEEAIARGSQERRLTSLRKVTDLFLRDAEALSDEQIES
jgi:hypothetical protein